MILLKKLQLISFLSHENTEIEFQKDGKILIDGQSGTGKSSIFDAIIWSLYGEGRADTRSLVRRGQKRATVVLELQKGEETVVITRSATVTGKHTLEATIQSDSGAPVAIPAQGIRGIQEWIEKELIGASYLLFVNSVAYVQGNGDSFVTQSAPKRKELLLEIVKAEDYDKYYEKARMKLQELQNEENFIKGTLSSYQGQTASLRAKISEKQHFLEEVKDCSVTLNTLKPQIEKLQVEKNKHISDGLKINSLLEKIDSLEESKTLLEKRLYKVYEEIKNKNLKLSEEEARNRISELSQKIKESDALRAKKDELYAQKPFLKDHNSEKIILKGQIETLTKADPCPSGDKCPYYSNKLVSLQLAQDRLVKLEEHEKEDTVKMTKWTEEVNAIVVESTTKYFEEINTLTYFLTGLETKKAIEEIDKKIKEIVSQKDELEVNYDKEKVNKIENELLSSRHEERQLNTQLTRATTMLEEIGKAEEELEKIKIESIDLAKKNTEIVFKKNKVTLVKDAFGSKGIKTIIIDYLLPKLEDHINEVLFKLSDFRVRLDTQRQSAGGEKTVEGLFITIINEMNEEMPYEAYSGGEKLKITVAISEALASLQKASFRLIDELVVGLDDNMVVDFTNVLNKLQGKFDQILAISHLESVKGIFEKKITVKKFNGISKIYYDD